MIPALVVFAYLGVVLYIGIFAFRTTRQASAEDYFPRRPLARPYRVSAVALRDEHDGVLHSRRVGARVRQRHRDLRADGVIVSARDSGVPLHNRHAALGARQAERLHDTGADVSRSMGVPSHRHAHLRRAGGSAVPYIIIAVMGGGTVLQAITNGYVPFWLGGAIVSSVVMAYVFLGGMRGTAWVNALQTTLFLLFGTIAVFVIGRGMGGFTEAMEALLASPATSPLLTRERVSPLYFFSYTFIPLSSIAFPHICIFCMTAQNVRYFRKTIVLYPICMLLIWMPSVFLGVVANQATAIPAIQTKLEARAQLAAPKRGTHAHRSRTAARAGGGRRCDSEARRRLRTAVAGGPARGGCDGGGHGERLADSRALDDVHGGYLRVLSRHETIRP
jgi:hypothetical protein